jgi:hypothetical protein
MAKSSSIKFSKTAFGIINLGGPHSLTPLWFSYCVMMLCRSNVMASRCVMMLCCCNVDVFAAILALVCFFYKMAASHSTMINLGGPHSLTPLWFSYSIICTFAA